MNVTSCRRIRRTSPEGRLRRHLSFSRTWLRAGAAVLLAFAPLALSSAGNAASSNTYIGPDNGSWSTATNWSAGVIPNGLGSVFYDVLNTGANTVIHSSSTGTGGIDTINTLLFTGLGGLNLSSGILAGTQLSAAGTFEVDNAFSLSGGTLRNFTINKGSGSGTLSANGGTLDSDVVNLSTINLTSGGSLLSLNSTFGTGATFNLNNGSVLDFQGTTTLTGDTISLGSTGTNTLALDGTNTNLTIGAGTTVSGKTANIGPVEFVSGTNRTLTNNGTISANVAGGTFTFNPTNLVNGGTIQALSGGTLNFGTTFTNTGTLLSSGAGSVVNLSGTITNTGGTISQASGGLLNLNSATVVGGTVSGGTVTNNGGGTLRNVTLSAATVDLTTTSDVLLVDNSGTGGSVASGTTFNVNNGAVLDFQGTTTLTGDTISLGSTGTNTLALDAANTNLTIGAGTTVSGKTATLGPVEFVSGSNRTLSNSGTISANVGGGTFTISPTNFVNNGTVQAQNGGTVALQATTTTDTGTIIAGAASTVTINSNLTQSGPTANTVADGTLSVNSGNGTLTVLGGVLGGSGTVQGNVVNSGGVVSPGDSPGTLTITGNGNAGTGNYTQGAGGALNIEFTASATDPNAVAHDQLNIAGTATLGGTLNILFLGPPTNGQYLATAGENGTTFDFLTFGTLGNAGGIGTLFSNEYTSNGNFFVNGIAADNTNAGPAVYQLSLDPNNNKALRLSLTTQAAPEPSQWVAFGLGVLGLGGLALRARRRQSRAV